MNMPAPSAATNSRRSNHLAMKPSPNAQNARAKYRRFIRMWVLFSKDQASIKQIPELLNHLNHRKPQRHQHRPRLQKMINRDVVGDRSQFLNRVLNHHLHEDQFHLALLSAKYSDHS